MRSKPKVEILVPLFNEEDSISILVKSIETLLKKLPYNFSFLFIDDGSTDRTLDLAKTIPSWPTKIIKLSKNFGKEIAVQSGIENATGDALILIDADMQDPIELIPQFLDQWENGYEIVYGIRGNRDFDPIFQRFTSEFFYRIFLNLANVNFPPHTTDARLVTKKVVNALKEMKDFNRFNKGIFHSIGFASIGVVFTRSKRMHGETRWPKKRLFALAKDAFLSFTTRPLYWSTYIGLIIAFISIALGVFFVIRKIFFDIGPSGYTSLIVAILFLGSIQLISLGILGLYVSQLIGETKKRPLYFVSEIIKLNGKR
jgi:glycosyltransferase involved in cell wall biosynthesis